MNSPNLTNLTNSKMRNLEYLILFEVNFHFDFLHLPDRILNYLQILKYTRMHSSRMRTGRSLTVFRSLLSGGGVPEQQTPPESTTPPDQPPPLNRMTDRCKNITLAKPSFRPVKIPPFHSIYLASCHLRPNF